MKNVFDEIVKLVKDGGCTIIDADVQNSNYKIFRKFFIS